MTVIFVSNYNGYFLLSLFGMKSKIPPRHWFWISPGTRIRRMFAFGTNSPTWAQWLFAPNYVSIQTTLESPQSFLSRLTTSSSGQTWPRESLCCWLCWSTANKGLTSGLLNVMIPGILFVFLGARMAESGPCMLTVTWFQKGIARTVLVKALA